MSIDTAYNRRYIVELFRGRTPWVEYAYDKYLVMRAKESGLVYVRLAEDTDDDWYRVNWCNDGSFFCTKQFVPAPVDMFPSWLVYFFLSFVD